MSTLDISPTLQLPPEFMTLTSAALGIRGSGKTNTGVVGSEELLEIKQQIIIIDPLDVWWGLKSSEDGKAPGYPIVVLGGTHADLPMGAEDGRAIADFLAETRTPAILSLRHISKNKQRQFVADFAEQLYQRKGEPGLNTPVLVVVDEASMFVPQSFQGDAARCVGAIEDLVRRGRASGLGVMLIDQRAASVNKDVLTQLEILFAHRTTSPQDRNALKAWIQAHDTGSHEKDFMESLAALGRGEAWVWSPELLDVFQRVQIRKRRTFDSSATPSLGQAVVVPDVVAPVDLEPLRARLGESVEEAKSSDPKALKLANTKLRAENERLKQELEHRPLEPVIVEVPVLSPEHRAQVQEQLDAMFAFGKDFMNLLHGIKDSLARFEEHEHERPVAPPPAAPKPPSTKVEAPPDPEPPSPPPPVQPQNVSSPVPSGVLNPTRQRLLNVLAEWESLGVPVVSRTNLGLWAGLKADTGSFSTHMTALNGAGLIMYPRANHVALTDEGREQAAPPKRIPTLKELHEAWYSRFKGTPGNLLRLIVGHYPASLSREELADALGIKADTGSFAAHMTGLKNAGVVYYPQAGYVAATDLMFPKGLK